MPADRSCTGRNEKFVQVPRIASDYGARILGSLLRSRDHRARSFNKITHPAAHRAASTSLARRVGVLGDCSVKFQSSIDHMSGFFEEVQRRKVYRGAPAYIIAAGFIIQIGSAVLPA